MVRLRTSYPPPRPLPANLKLVWGLGGGGRYLPPPPLPLSSRGPILLFLSFFLFLFFWGLSLGRRVPPPQTQTQRRRPPSPPPTPTPTSTQPTTTGRFTQAQPHTRVTCPVKLEWLAMSAGHGAARRRRGRQLRAWHRHERMTVAMELATALHHSAQPAGPVVAGPSEVEEQDKHEALRRQRAPPPRKRPGVLKEPEVQGAAVMDGYVAAGAPLLVVASLAGRDEVDATTVSFLLRENLRRTKLEEEEKERRRDQPFWNRRGRGGRGN